MPRMGNWASGSVFFPKAFASFALSNDRTVTRYASNPVVAPSVHTLDFIENDGYYYYLQLNGSGLDLWKMNLDYTGTVKIGTLFYTSAINSSGCNTAKIFRDTLDGNKWKVIFSMVTGTNMNSYIAVGTTNILDSMTVNTNPVISLGASGEFDSNRVRNPVVLIEGSTYYIWYVGHNGTLETTGLASGTSLAVSGTHSFTKLGQKISTETNGLSNIYKHSDGKYYLIIFSSFGTSLNASVYSFTELNPVKDTGIAKVGTNTKLFGLSGTGGEITQLYDPCLVVKSNKYQIFYKARNDTSYQQNLIDVT